MTPATKAEHFLLEHRCDNLVLSGGDKLPYKYASDLMELYAKECEKELGNLIHYPEHWNVDEYPTMESALMDIGGHIQGYFTPTVVDEIKRKKKKLYRKE